MANESSRQQSGERAQAFGTSQQGSTGAQRGQGSEQQGGYGAHGASGQQSAYAQGGSGRSGGALRAGGQDEREGRGGYGMPAARGASRMPARSGGGAQALGPFSAIQRITEEMDRLFESFGMGRNFFPEEMSRGAGAGAAVGAPSLWSPHIEIAERNGKLMIQADLPGVDRNDVNVEIEPEAVIIRGERTQQSERRDQGYYHSERSYGSFYRTIPLPEGIDIDAANATFRNGVLEIELPMPQRPQRGRRLEVRDAGSGSTYQGTVSSGGASGSDAAGATSGASRETRGSGTQGSSGSTSTSGTGSQHGSGGTP